MTADDFSQLAVGTVLADKYRISREIGRGGMAAVYEAENIGIGKRVAVKVLAAELTTSRVVRERFLREARAAAAVRSPYICDVYDVGEFDNRPFLVMELLEGESLYDRMTRVRRLDIPFTLQIMTQTAKGLAKAHSGGIVHRDLKPENLFLTRNEEAEVVTKLLDFGLAKFYAPTDGAAQVRLTREGALFGTPAYMSPEQAKGRGEVDHRADLWALGCIVYECLTGHTVWNVEQGVAMILAQVANAQLPVPSKLRPDLPPAFDEWFKKALQRAPEDRFQTAGQFAIALTEALTPGDSGHLQTPSLLVDVDDILHHVANNDREADDVQVFTSAPEHPAASGANAPEAARRSPAVPLQSSRQGMAAGGTAVDSRAVSQQPTSSPQSFPGQPATVPARESAPPQFRRRKLPVLLALLGFAGVLGTGAYVYREHLPAVFREPESRPKSEPNVALSSVGTQPPLDAQGIGRKVVDAQGALHAGKMDDAVRLLDEAIKSGGEGIGTNLRNHLRAAQETPSAPCHLTAIGRPRPFPLSDPPSRPTIVANGKQAVVAWVGAHEDKTRRQVYTTLLDEALRRISPAQLVSPESLNARYPQLWPVEKGSALLFWDATRKQSGIFARHLESGGRIQGSLRNIAPLTLDEYAPAVARAEDGTYWIVWEDDAAVGAQNLNLRHVDADFNALGSIVALTALKPDRATHPSAIRPAIAISQGKLRVLFTLRQANQRRVYSLIIAAGARELATAAAPSVSTRVGDAEHRFLAPVHPLGSEGVTSDDARTHCQKDACFALWGEESAGIVAMALDPASNTVLWRHAIGPKGMRPAIASNGQQLMAVWYESSRVRVAQLDRFGAGTVASVGKVSGLQPLPDVAPTGQPQRWLVAWRDYESGHFEAMAAAVNCQAEPPHVP